MEKNIKLLIAIPACLLVLLTAVVLIKAVPADKPEEESQTEQTEDMLRMPDKTVVKTDGRILSKEEKLKDIEENYPRKEENENETYYYKEVGGIKTEDYYAVGKDGSVFKSETVITDEEKTALEEILRQNPELLQQTIDIPHLIPSENETSSPDGMEKHWESQTEPILLIQKTDEGLRPVKIIRAVYTQTLPNDAEGRYIRTFTMNLLDGTITEEEEIAKTA